MLEKAIRKAVLPILLASLMVGAGCRITYAEEQQQTTDVNPDFRCVGEWYTENG